MSAFVVSRETINACCAARLAFNARLTFSQKNCNRGESLNEFGQSIWRLNTQAVGYRYSQRPQRLPRFEFDPAKEYLPSQQLKSLHCLMYQCSEGKYPNRKLFKELEKLAAWLASEIACGSMEYENAEWDLRDWFSRRKTQLAAAR